MQKSTSLLEKESQESHTKQASMLQNKILYVPVHICPYYLCMKAMISWLEFYSVFLT